MTGLRLAIALLALWAASPAAAACQNEVEPNETAVAATPLAAPDFCVKGSVKGDDQDWFAFDVTKATLWHLRLEAPPGGNGGVRLSRLPADGGAEQGIWSANIDPATGLVTSPDLLLMPGRWAVQIGGSSDRLLWRLHGEAQALPPDTPATDAPMVDAFTRRLTATGETQDIAWTLTPDAARHPWTLTLQGPAEAYPDLELRGPDDKAIFEEIGGGAAHLVRRIDLGLAAGDYHLRVKGLDPDAVAVLTAAMDAGETGTDFVREPDGRIDQAHALTPGQSLSGRLHGSGDSYDADFYSFSLPDTGSALARFGIDLAMPEGPEIDLSLTDASGQDISDSYQLHGPAHLGPFALPPGSYGLRLNGLLPESAHYTVTLRSADPVPPGREAEPNDRPAFASVVAAGGRIAGDGADRTVDYVAIDVPRGDLRWWTLRAKAEGAIDISLLDGQGQVLNHTRGTATEVTLARLPLAQGRNLVKLYTDAAWSLSVEPAPSPEPGDEREPNDDALNATLIRPGIPVRFWLDHLDDNDSFALPLTAAQRLVLQVKVGAAALPRGELRMATQGQALPLEFAPDPVDPSVLTARLDTVLPAGTALLTLRADGLDPGPGSLTADLLPPFAAPPAGAAGTMTPATTDLAADLPQMQRLAGQVVLTPPPEAGGRGRLQAWVSNGEWRLLGLPAEVPLAGPVTLNWRLEAPPWLQEDETADLAVALTDPVSGAMLAVASGRVTARTGAAPQDPAPFAALPEPLLGALDVARGDFGGRIAPETAAALTDGQLDGTATDLPAEGVTVTLAGNAPLAVAGLVLTPPSGGDAANRLHRYRVEASSDGVVWQAVQEAAIDPVSRPQPLVFDKPVLAHMIRLTPLDAWGDTGGAASQLSELNVLTAPENLPDAFDLARPELGGHLIRATPTSLPVIGESGEWPGHAVQFDGAPGTRAFFVMGFFNARAAPLSLIRLRNDPSVGQDARDTAIQVEASLQGPLGPWTALGTVTMDPASGEGVLNLPPDTWARDLRFTVESPDASAACLPAAVSVIEDRASEGGATVLGEWGAAARDATWERRKEDLGAEAGLTGAATPGVATILPPGVVAAGQVSHAAQHSYYRLDPPEGALTLTIARDNDGAALAMTDAAGQAVALQATPDGLAADISARRGPFLLDVFKAQDSVVVAWDTSGSVASLASAIFAAVRDLAGGLSQGELAMNFVPFRSIYRNGGGGPLLDRFATDAGTAIGALNAYVDPDSDSDSEAALIVAARALAKEPGRHAIVLITDASFSNGLTEESWAALGLANPRIYALRVPSGSRDAAARAQAALMQDWAAFNHGTHSIFADPADARAAFRSLAADLRRPVPYRLSWNFTTAPPPPATLSVVPGEGGAGAGEATASAVPRRSIEVILDASGSMLQKVGGKRKIEIAKSILADLAARDLPRDTDFALRVFGTGGKGSCEGKAVLPLGPLDPAAAARAIAAVKALNGARTAIGASLRDAGADLAEGKGARLIVLITDGEETCGGDPAAEITALRDKGFDLRLNIVGFDLDTPALKDQFAAWAAAGGGAFFDASDAAALGTAVRSAVAVEFRLLAQDGSLVAQGTVGGPAVQAPPGRYRLNIGDGQADREILLAPGQTMTVTLGAD